MNREQLMYENEQLRQELASRDRDMANVIKVNYFWIPVAGNKFTPPQWVFDAREEK